MLEQFTGSNCNAEKAIDYAKSIGNDYLTKIANALDITLNGREVSPIRVTSEEKEDIMRSIDEAIGGCVVGKDQFLSGGTGIDFNPIKQALTKYYKLVAKELFQVQQ